MLWAVWISTPSAPEEPDAAWLQAVGITWLFVSWAACFAVQPAKMIAQIATGQRIKDAIERAEGKIQKWSSSLGKIPGLRNADRGRLVVSMSESTLVRNVARPVTIPLKLWVAWRAVSLAKSPQR